MARSVKGNEIRDFNYVCTIEGRDGDFVRIGKPGTQNTRVAQADFGNGVITGESFLVSSEAVRNLKKFADMNLAADSVNRQSLATRTIRIDEEVWEWIKRHAEPLEDTPNSTLRRIAGLDATEQDASKSPQEREDQ